MVTSILLADDHKAITDGVEKTLGKEIDLSVVKVVHDGNKLVESLANLKVDVIISDVAMPGLSGLELLNELNQKAPNTKVIFLSMHNDVELIRTYLHSGLWAYVLKDSGLDELIKAIRSIKSSIPYNCRSTTKLLKTAKEKDLLAPKLTKRELQIIKLIAKDQKIKTIAELLNVEPSTIETHKKNIFRKIGVNSSVGLVSFAYENRLLS